jgi:hypothetical protein
MAESSPLGVGPLMPVAEGSPPKVRAWVKSVSRIWARGSALGVEPPAATAAWSATRGSMPSTPLR